jgi:hypothetical protein
MLAIRLISRSSRLAGGSPMHSMPRTSGAPIRSGGTLAHWSAVSQFDDMLALDVSCRYRLLPVGRRVVDQRRNVRFLSHESADRQMIKCRNYIMARTLLGGLAGLDPDATEISRDPVNGPQRCSKQPIMALVGAVAERYREGIPPLGRGHGRWSRNDFRTMPIVSARPASPAGFLFSADVVRQAKFRLYSISGWAGVSAQDDDK